MNTTEKKPIGVRSLQTQILLDCLRKAIEANAEIVTWDELTAALGENIHDHNSKLLTARKIVLREFERDFITIRNVGIKPATPEEALSHAQDERRGVSKKAKRAMEILYHGCKYDELPKEKQASHNTEMSVLAMLSHAAQERTVKKIASKVESAGVKLSLEGTLEALRNAKS